MIETTRVQQDMVPAVFSSREAAEAAIQHLRMLGFGDADLGLAIPKPGHYVLEDRDDAEAAESAAKGAVGGVPIGSLAGLLLVGLVIPGADELAVAGLLAGGLWGAFLGGFGGLLAKVRWNADEDRWCEIPLGGKDVLVTVRAGERADEVHRILREHGATCFLDVGQ